MARPTRCTPERIKRIADAIRAGNYAETAARYGGIGETTYYEWMKKGEKGEEPYAEFREAVKEAEAIAEARSVALIQQAGQAGTWQASAWFLERKFPSKWGRRDRMEHTGKGGGPITLAGMAEMLREGQEEDGDDA